MPLAEVLKEVVNEEGVTGALISDANGLCIETQGAAQSLF